MRKCFLVIVLVWVAQVYYDFNGAINFLNTLSLKRAREAKIVTGVDAWGRENWVVVYRGRSLADCEENCE